MVSFSNVFIGLVNILTAIISIPIIAFGILLYRHPEIECDRVLQAPFLGFGTFLLLLSIFGLIGSCCRSSNFMWIYLVFMLLLITMLCSFMVFAITMTSKGESPDALHGALNGRLDEYSSWVHNVIMDKSNWDKIKSCVKGFEVCEAMYNPHYFRELRLLYKRNLARIQNGCCKPPDECGLVHAGKYVWNPPPPSGVASSANGDCGVWNNDVNRLCYQCDSCKAGFLANVDRIVWRRLSIYIGLLLFLLILVYSIGCCALHNTRLRRRRRRRLLYRRYNNVGYI